MPPNDVSQCRRRPRCHQRQLSTVIILANPTPLAKVIRVLIDKQIDAVTGMTVMTFLLLAAATDTIEHMYEAPREDIERIKAQAHEMAQNKH